MYYASARNPVDIIERFTAVLNQPLSPKRFNTELEGWMPTTVCNGHWNGEAGMKQY
jgi:hypothetical protein